MADAAAQLPGGLSEATSSRTRWLAGSLIISAMAVLAALYITQIGAGASGDSVHYLMGAENILQGNGYARSTGDGTTRPITHFPPLFSVMIAAVGIFGIEVTSAARWLNAVLFGANLWLASYLVYRGSRSVFPSLLTPIVLAAAAPLVGLHGWVMSEPVYIFFSLLALVGLHHYLEAGDLRSLLIAAVAVALATLTRYVGLSLVLTGGLAVLIFGDTENRQRLRHAFLFGLISVALIGSWFVRNLAISGAAANREIAFHPIRRELVDQYVAVAVEWIFARAIIPWRFRILAAVTIGLAAPVALMIRDVRLRGPQRLMGKLEWLLILYLPSYFLALAMNSYWFDASAKPSDAERYLAPAFAAMIILMIVSSWKWWVASAPRSPIRVVIPIVGLFLIGLHVLETAPLFADDGLDRGYVTLADDNPDLARALSDLRSDRVLISNNPELVFVMSGRPAFAMPIAFDISTQEARQDFEHQVSATVQRLEEGGRLVVFGILDPVDQQTLASIEAVRFDTFIGAAIYGYVDR